MKTVLITGCSAGGIGSALAEAFQKKDLHVFATARDPAKMSHLESLPNVTIIPLDPTSSTSVEDAARTISAETDNKLDYLVNNAGQTVITPTLDFNIDDVKNMYDINVFGHLRVTQAFAPLVIEAKGTIVNISSISTVCHTPWMGVYAGSKAAMTQISDTLRMELAPFSVKVVTVMTGAVGSKTLATEKQFKVPPTSRYRSIEKVIAARARGEDGVPRMEPSVFAEKVVNDVLLGANWQIWHGGWASIVRYMSSWIPGIFDSFAIKGTGLDAMSTRVA
ncbi:MAG: hypothetical protein M1820_002491 [Bogoriella megaspora]|nr:MAG: hypothetical protein M1820_002491 [Bogoriella megaspora]